MDVALFPQDEEIGHPAPRQVMPEYYTIYTKSKLGNNLCGGHLI
jgi:hypothetical protein